MSLIALTMAISLGGIEDRVATARHLKEAAIRRDLRSIGVPYPARVYLRGLKREHLLELWVAPRRGSFRLFRKYPIQALSGFLGPKRQEGDLQVPEGLYSVVQLNPRSRFLLSMRLNYPNRRDLAHAVGRPGADIFIHGNHLSAGCLAMGDDAIREIYLLVASSPAPVRADIFPTRMTPANWNWLAPKGDRETLLLWSTLYRVYRSFGRNRIVPSFRIVRGEYVLT